MFTKKLTYTDYNGVERTETFRFNLTQSEIVEMQMETEGGLDKLLQKIIEAKAETKLIGLFKDLVLRAYGEISDDGKRFIKNSEIREAFSQTEAYNMIFMELVTDTDAAEKFVNCILPKNKNEIASEKQQADVFKKLAESVSENTDN